MSFLAPVYILGALAVSLPVLFHLIRRTPRGRVRFSSLMFLGSSPPRITRRSRLDNRLLLFLRAAALCLLALAFARPFFREAAQLGLDAPRKRVVILLDTSASMRRGDLWSRAVARVEKLIDEAGANDELALFTFDDRVERLVDFADAPTLSHAERRTLVRRRLAAARPGWGATDLGSALVTAADSLDRETHGGSPPAGGRPYGTAFTGALQVVVVTDLQRGSRLEALSSWDWPERVRLAVEAVSPPRTSNAGVALLGDGAPSEAEEARRVRVSNDSRSDEDRFALAWASGSDEPAGTVVSVHVPPGESRVVALAPPAGESGQERLTLSGDDHEFDNTIHFVPERPVETAVLYVGSEDADDTAEPRYYVERALEGDGARRVSFVTHPAESPLPSDAEPPVGLVIVTADPGKALERGLRRYVRSGGTVLFVVRDATATRSLGALLECGELSAEEAVGGDYAMLGDIDFSHPVFGSFADPRFSDFTKIRFWRHRRLRWDASRGSDVRVIARFDNGDPAVLERTIGSGRIIALASGWQPADSQLALSTKFVPLIAAIFETGSGKGRELASFHVHDRVPVPPVTKRVPRRRVLKPDGAVRYLLPSATTFDDTDRPGVYELDCGGGTRRFAVNVAPAESRTAPLAVEALEEYGVRLGLSDGDAAGLRQLRDAELESSQKAWKWILVGALGFLILESWLAGRIARSTTLRKEGAA